jgi:hypothetical protein
VYRELDGITALTEIALAWQRHTHSAIIENFLATAREATTDPS